MMYRITYSNSAVVLVEAVTPAAARMIAEDQAADDGYPGLSVVRVEAA